MPHVDALHPILTLREHPRPNARKLLASLSIKLSPLLRPANARQQRSEEERDDAGNHRRMVALFAP
jgi:hypothetical protein